MLNPKLIKSPFCVKLYFALFCVIQNNALVTRGNDPLKPDSVNILTLNRGSNSSVISFGLKR
jgi:hypothetical protein